MLIRKIAGLVLLIVGLAFILSFISSLNFSKTGFEGFIGAGPFEKQAGEGNQKWDEIRKLPATFTKSNMCNLKNFSNPPQLPIYFVEGLNAYTNHMRLYTASTYANGVWIEDNVSYTDRPELSLSPHVTRYKVTPIVPFKVHIPVSKDTCYVSINAKFNMSTGMFLITSCDEPYFAVSTAYKLNATKVAKEGFAKIEMKPNEYNAIRQLALEVTKNAKNDYEKALLIQEFLKKHYRYDPTYTIPANEDPIYWFLFREKRGICKHFASAFVIMCNSIGIPARLVVGYLAEPIPQNQTVFASQAHAWAEVKFEEGWMEFDPTPSPVRVPTITEITKVKDVVEKGQNFTVEGYVKTKDGKPIDGYVEIYLKKRKEDEKGILLKLAPFKNGHFKVNVTAPDLVGEYHVLAHYVGSLAYLPSWSDPIIKIYSPPHFDVKIPDKVSTNLTIRGRLLDYNGTGIANARVIVKVDGVVYDETKTDVKGYFLAFVRLSKGEHEIELFYPGSKFILPMSYKKKVEAGDIDVILSNATVWAGKENQIVAAILFNGKPIKNESVRILWQGGEIFAKTDGRGILRFKVKPENVGMIPVEFDVFGYNKIVMLKSISGVKISASYESGILNVNVKDEVGNTLDGRIIINGKSYRLENGVARINTSGSKFEIYYPGDEFHPPAKLVYEVHFPFWLLLIPICLVIGLYYFKSIRGSLRIVVETEIENLPLIWKVGEEIRFRVESKDSYRVFVDGKPFEGNSVRFDEEGEHIIRVERMKDGKVKEVRIRIVDDYGKAIAEIFKNLVARVEKMKKIDLKDATPREVIGMLKPCRADLLLRLFELYKYGNRRGFSRSDFIEAFKDYREVLSCAK